jgi:hypothetical protein
MIPSHSGRNLSTKADTKESVVKLLDEFVELHKVIQSQSQEETERKNLEGMAGEVEKVLLQLKTQDFLRR